MKLQEKLPNAGMHYSFTTGPISEKPPSDDTVYGQAVLPDGITPANGALVYVTTYDNDGLGSSGYSTTLSSLVEECYRNVQLANSRLLDMSIPFQYSNTGDILQIKIYTPDGFTLSTSLDTGNDSPAPILQTEEICTDEICDFIDNDCDGLVDEEGAQGCMEYFMDNDGDGYGVGADFLCLCAPYETYRAIQGGDTDDTDPTVPIAVEEECKFSVSIMATGLDLGESKESAVIIGIGNFAKTVSLYSEPL